MQVSEARTLLENAGWNKNIQLWADLGCGKGIFTAALAGLLHEGSCIYAVDQDSDDLHFVPAQLHDVKIEKIPADFTTAVSVPLLDGILMANSLHYVRDRNNFGLQLRSMLKPKGRLLIVEYDTDTANRWVPFPLSFSTLQQWAAAIGFAKTTRLGERASIYQRAKIYSALIE